MTKIIHVIEGLAILAKYEDNPENAECYIYDTSVPTWFRRISHTLYAGPELSQIKISKKDELRLMELGWHINCNQYCICCPH